MVTLPDNIIGLDEASKALDALIADEAPAAAGQPEDSANAEQRAAQPEGETMPTDQPMVQTDTQAEAQPETTKATDGAEAPAAEKPKTRFEKAQERLPVSWKEFNSRREAFEAERAAKEAELQKQRAEFEQSKTEWERSHREPDARDYEAHAGRLQARAKAIQAEADKLEDAGKYQEAEAKRREALKLTHYAEDALTAAEETRKNPPDAKRAERIQKLEAARKEWTLKAATDFPAFAKAGTPQASKAAEIIQTLQKSDPDIAEHPKAVYFAAELAEAQCVAARVPDLEKRLAAYEARVKELEALTQPGGSGLPGPVDAPSGDSLGELERQAREMGGLY